ncbi:MULTISPECIES: ATP-dependent DNA helicase [unclassified Methylophilus]|uniref:ATP-dependent DNA helicase n=1 Tax=unclassified Methylophilus TaxID=2630143 RepID=UPI0023B276FE|nr:MULTISPECIES: ATP-dependent DNA helicase [unclassified Methylophilus]MDF0378183.1 ATP-dependent DNA helicase [Methylophilus sp. YYY-1]MDT7849171.1 ATP-dependent DNA helicase [Methylophilus sp. VKM B-3414]
MSLAQQVSSAFSENGSLAQAMPDFRSRPQQQEMALAIAEAIEQQQQLVAEAGTGTGKTYAYLVPALLSGGKVIISTGTKTLQDQLFQRDLPAVREALKVPVSVAMLKGRANYLCHYHLQRASQEGRFQSREDAQYIPILQSFAEHSQTGDKAELVEVPEQATVWQQVTSTRDNCVGQDCQFYKQCFVMEARKQALAADVVVVNHHLFFADVMLRDEGVAELLPSANTVVFDEAHQLPEVAGLFFGEDISTSQLMDLARDSQMAYLSLAKDCVALSEAVPPLEKACRDFRLVFQFEGSRMPAQKAQTMKNFDEAFQRMLETLAALTAVLETQAGRDPLLEKCWQRGEALLALLQAWLKGNHANLVRWVEVFSQSVQLHATPLSVADGFGKQLNAQPRAWIFTSATLAVKSDFSHYQSQMGLLAAQTRHWQSPFDYGQQALLYVPTGMPEPNSSAYAAAVAAVSLPVLQASRGRAFVLCTSLKAMREVHALLKNAFEELGLNYPLLMQGESNRTELLDRFRSHGNAVLVGSQSFWEGVDVRGEALSCVIIDKLPFAPPDDPVLAARIDKMNAEGKNAFMEYQLPYAVITLKQGAGRLIRDEQDVGVLMICDPRLVDKPYGRRIWQSLPPFKRTRVQQEVEDFFAVINGVS